MKEAEFKQEVDRASMPGGYNNLFVSKEKFIDIPLAYIVDPTGGEDYPQDGYCQIAEETYCIPV